MEKINWAKYNKELINRGSLTLWFSLEDEKQWYSEEEPKRKGRRFHYSWIAIELICLLRFRFGLTLRGVQGFAQSLLKMMDIDLEVPDYSTLGRRMGKMNISIIQSAKKSGRIHVAIDSTGLKVYGEGEWKVKIHGRGKHRTWRKLHLAVDTKNNKILSAVLTTNDFKDNQVFEDTLEGISDIKAVSADGAYDSKNCYAYAKDKKFKLVAPPRKNAKISRRGSEEARDKAIREIRSQGRRAWKKKNKYHRRSLSETAMSRMKVLMGDKLKSRKFESQASEAFVKVKILNKMKTPKDFFG
jgi:hypothetical protein